MVEWLIWGALLCIVIELSRVTSNLEKVCNQIRRIAFWAEDYYEDKGHEELKEG